METLGRVYQSEEYDQLPPVDQNVARVGEIVDEERELLEEALSEAAQAGRPGFHKEAETNRFAVLAARISSIVREFEILEPVDTEFVIDMMQILEESNRTGTGPEPQLQRKMSQAVQNLQVRNAEPDLID
jgi:hypothetical protein